MRKENPRAASSNWKDETPRSSTTPSSAATPDLVQQRDHVAELAVQQMQPAGMLRDEACPALDGVGIPIDRPQRAGGVFQDGAGVAAAAERAVEVDAAIARIELRNDLGEHHGNMTVHSTGLLRSGIERIFARASAMRRAPAAGSQI